MWGGVAINDCGVILPAETIDIVLPGGRTKCDIRLAPCPNGWWAMSTGYDHSGGGGGSYPSVWDTTAYASREDAIAGGVAELTKAFEWVKEWGAAYGPTTQRTEADRMLAELKAQLGKTQQLTLF